jgi:hypothetical protein
MMMPIATMSISTTSITNGMAAVRSRLGEGAEVTGKVQRGDAREVASRGRIKAAL